MLEFILSYWWLLVISLAGGAVGGYAVFAFTKLSKSEQINSVKEWLLYAVSQTEKELGGRTGALKLRMAYDMFVAKFPHLVRIISFERFSELVDEALTKFKNMLTSNPAVKNMVEGSEKE